MQRTNRLVTSVLLEKQPLCVRHATFVKVNFNLDLKETWYFYQVTAEVRIVAIPGVNKCFQRKMLVIY